MEVSKVFCNFWAPWVAHILPLVWYFFLLKNTHKWFMQRGSVGGNKKKLFISEYLRCLFCPYSLVSILQSTSFLLFSLAFWKILSCCLLASIVAAEKIEMGSVSIFLSVISLSLSPSFHLSLITFTTLSLIPYCFTRLCLNGDFSSFALLGA